LNTSGWKMWRVADGRTWGDLRTRGAHGTATDLRRSSHSAPATEVVRTR
jgi:hypothetical protein